MKFLPLISAAVHQAATEGTEPNTDISACDGQCVDPLGLATCKTSANDPGYECNCNAGYTWNGAACEDNDECADPSLAAACDAAQGWCCENEPGTYGCSCCAGWKLDELAPVCNDVDECTDGTHNCEDPNPCHNIDGGFECGCPVGYIKNGDACDDVNECVNEVGEDSGVCAEGDVCVNTIGSYGCKCATAGYEWNGTACADADECAAGICSPSSICENSDGSYSCSCKEGYTDKNGDGHVCEFNDYPESYTWIPHHDQNSMFFISSNSGKYSNMKNAQNAAADMSGQGYRGLLCEEFFDLPHGYVKPDTMYICDDESQPLTHTRYTNKGNNNCVFENYQITCGMNPWQYPPGADQRVDFIAVNDGTNGSCVWDRSVGETYLSDSNQGHGQFYDTALCSMQVKGQEAAASICQALGGSLFQEEVHMHLGAVYDDEVDGCNAMVEDSAKAHGRLYQATRIDPTFNGQALTGYRANDNGDNWCWLAAMHPLSVCIDTLPMSEAPVGMNVDPNVNWQVSDTGFDCNDPAMASAISSALRPTMGALSAVTAGRAVLWDYATELYTTAPEGNTFDNFICERYAWDCTVDNGGCGDNATCNNAGYCDCNEGFFLSGNKECVPEPDKVMIECFDDKMIAYFAVDSINHVDASAPLRLNEEGAECTIDIIDGYYRIETPLDGCGTVASYNYDAAMESTIVFSNTFTNAPADGNDAAFPLGISISSSVESTFECQYRMVTEVSDVNGLLDAGEANPGGIGVHAATASAEKAAVGEFSFELNIYDADNFASEADANSPARVGENLFFGLTSIKSINNVVHRATRCSVLNFDGTEEYVLFDDAVGTGTVDPFVEVKRYVPWYTDVSGNETCGAKDSLDKFSYTVFEFIDRNTGLPVTDGTQSIKCNIAICIKDDDMSNGPCAKSICENMWTNDFIAAITTGSI